MLKEIPSSYSWICSTRLGGCGYVGLYTDWKVRQLDQEHTTFDCPRCGEYHVAKVHASLPHFIYFTDDENWRQASALFGEEFKFCHWFPGNPSDYTSLRDIGRAMLGRRLLHRYIGGSHDGEKVYPDLSQGIRVINVGFGPSSDSMVHKDDIRLLVARLVQQQLEENDEEGGGFQILRINPGS
jgi:hypothetical protein